jgi:hypothetical protein
LAADVKACEQTKFALRFDPKHPLSLALVRKRLRGRIAETDADGTARGAARAEQARSRARREQANALIAVMAYVVATSRSSPLEGRSPSVLPAK